MRERIISIMSTILECSVTQNSTQLNTENWDSLRHLNLMIALENEFDVEFEPEEMVEMKNVIKIEEMVNKKITQ